MYHGEFVRKSLSQRFKSQQELMLNLKIFQCDAFTSLNKRTSKPNKNDNETGLRQGLLFLAVHNTFSVCINLKNELV